MRVLSSHIEVKDNHFAMPLGKTDLLKAPDHFPPAVTRYTLKEMSLVWYMYGGRDFASSPPSQSMIYIYYILYTYTIHIPYTNYSIL